MNTKTISYIKNLLENKKTEFEEKFTFLEKELENARIELDTDCRKNNIQCFEIDADNLSSKKKVNKLYYEHCEIGEKYNEIKDVYQDFINHEW